MTVTKKTRVGLLGLMLELYDVLPDLKPEMAAFGQELVEALSPFAEAEFSGVCNTRQQVDEAVAAFEADGKDLLIVVLLTYAPSHIALPALQSTKLPILIFNTQQMLAVTGDTTSPDTLRNHGMHGVQDLANVLLRAGRDFHLVTGHYQDERALAEVRAWCDAVRTARFMRSCRVGQIGYSMEGMGDFGVDQTALLAQLGVGVHHIAMKRVAQRAAEAPADEVERQMAFDRETFEIEEGVTDAIHEANSRLEWAIRDILESEGLHGFAPHFGAIGDEGVLPTLPFLAAAKLLGEGYGFGGEGDVTSAAAVAMMAELAGEANFTEMFSMDFAGNSALMMHMGEGNWRLARDDEPVHMLHAPFSLADLDMDPVLLAFSLRPGDVTLLSLTTGPEGRLRFVVTEGQVVDFKYLPTMRRPSYKFSPDGDLSDFLTRFSLAGGSHHQALAYGRRADVIEKVASLLGIACERV